MIFAKHAKSAKAFSAILKSGHASRFVGIVDVVTRRLQITFIRWTLQHQHPEKSTDACTPPSQVPALHNSCQSLTFYHGYCH